MLRAFAVRAVANDYLSFSACSVVDTGAKSFCTQESRMPMSISSLVSICQDLCIWLWRLNRLNSVYCPWSWALHGLYNYDKRALIPASNAEWQGYGIPFLMVIAFPASAYLAERMVWPFLLNGSCWTAAVRSPCCKNSRKCTMSQSSGLGSISNSMVQTQDEAAEMLQVSSQLLLHDPCRSWMIRPLNWELME